MINRIIVFFSLVVCCCMADVGKITIKVVEDSSGAPITNAYVTAGFNNYIKPGWGWGGGKPTRDSGYTDKNGLCTLSATCNDPSVGYGARKEGYYGSGGYSLRFTNTTGIVRKRWEPWNPTLTVPLKRTGNPIPMYVRGFSELKVPVTNTAIGFDMIIGDWVEPYGRGQNSDIFFHLSQKFWSGISRYNAKKSCMIYP